MELVIFGAQAIALSTCQAIRKLVPERQVRYFLVSERGKNADTLAGLPVNELTSFAEGLSQKEKDNTEVLIATPENIMPEIEKILDDHGLCKHMRYDSVRWAELMERYFVSTGGFRPLSVLPVGFHKADIRLFMAKFYKDAPLHTDFRVPDYIKPIQVGAALCSERVADIVDNEGDQISEKNVNYSELTALYWIWKNILSGDGDVKEQYYGLTHYRRILSLSSDDLLRLVDNEVDVVLPYPMSYEPDMEQHHRKYLRQEDWDALLAALEELQPEYAESFSSILRQPYMYHYNIILARGSVLADYCSWLFPILERIEELSVPKGSDRADRYIGYMGETLETLYFMHNRDKLNITYSGCRFLV